MSGPLLLPGVEFVPKPGQERGDPVRSIDDLAAWLKYRRVAIRIRFTRKHGYEVVARRDTHHIRVRESALDTALGIIVDSMNDLIAYHQCGPNNVPLRKEG